MSFFYINKISNNLDISNHNGDNTGLKLSDTLIKATAAELNILDGVTATAAELNLVDGSSAGTIVNSKAVIYSAAGKVSATSIDVVSAIDGNADLTIKSSNTTDGEALLTLISDNGTDAGDGFQIKQVNGVLTIKSDHGSLGTYDDTLLTITGNTTPENRITAITGKLSISNINEASGYTDDKFIVSDSNEIKYLNNTDLATAINAVQTNSENTFSKLQLVDAAITYSSVESLAKPSHLRIGNSTPTDVTNNFSTGSTTVSQYNTIEFHNVNLKGKSGESTTTTTASTVSIDGAPVAGTDMTITNAYALNVSGRVNIAGPLCLPIGTLQVGDDAADDISATSNTYSTTASDFISVSELTNSTMHFKVAGDRTADTYYGSMSISTSSIPPKNGQLLIITFDNTIDAEVLLSLNFSSGNLISGSGSSQYLTFSSTGQSAMLIYIDSKWRIINTGAAIS